MGGQARPRAGRPGPRQGSAPARLGAQTQVGWCPEDLRAGVPSLWGLAGQLLLVEAHDMVHELVLLACLDHAAPGGRDTWGHGVVDRWAVGGRPQTRDYQSFARGLVFV